jgi:hypothetical protein
MSTSSVSSWLLGCLDAAESATSERKPARDVADPSAACQVRPPHGAAGAGREDVDAPSSRPDSPQRLGD